jgi:hypothetical protein
MIKVLIVQANHDHDGQNIRDLEAAIARGHTDEEGWQMPVTARPGDLVVFYQTKDGGFRAWGFVEGEPWRVEGEYGPVRGRVAAVQPVDPLADDWRMIKAKTGVDGGHEGYQTVKPDVAVRFLQLLQLLPLNPRPETSGH